MQAAAAQLSQGKASAGWQRLRSSCRRGCCHAAGRHLLLLPTALSRCAAAQCSCCAVALQTRPVHTHTGKITSTRPQTPSPAHRYLCMPHSGTHTHAASIVNMHVCTKAQSAHLKLPGSAAAPGAAPVTQLLLQPAAAAARTAGCQQHSRHLLLHTIRRAAAHAL